MMDVNLDLTPKQSFVLDCGANDIGYGGAVAGGKSFLLRAISIIFASQIPGFTFGLFRRNEGELIDTHINGRGGYVDLLSPWVEAGICKILTGKSPRVEFLPTRSRILMCHCSNEVSWRKYLSYEFDAIGIDESTTFSPRQKSEIRNRLRTAIPMNEIPEQFRGLFPWICEATNPGGISSHSFKADYIDGKEPMEIYDIAPGVRRVFVPSLLTDNPHIMENDPSYEHRLKANNSEQRYRALRYGEWVTEGAFFPEFGDRNICEPFPIPEHWYRFRAMDWGFASPFSIGWYAIAAETINHPLDGRVIKRGCIVQYREWYGIAKRDNGEFIPNVGLRLTAKEVAEGIKLREDGEDIKYGVLDPSAFAEDGGPSHAETMGVNGVVWLRADNKRTAKNGAGGWDQMRQRIRGNIKEIDGDEPVYDHPMLIIFNTCEHTNRTIPEVQHSETNPEDVEKKGEDHAADKTRYACMSRPLAGPTWTEEDSPLHNPSFSDLMAQNSRKRTQRVRI